MMFGIFSWGYLDEDIFHIQFSIIKNEKKNYPIFLKNTPTMYISRFLSNPEIILHRSL